MFYTVRPTYLCSNIFHVNKVNRVYERITSQLIKDNVRGYKAVVIKNERMQRALKSGDFSSEEYTNWKNSQSVKYKYKYSCSNIN